MNLNDNPTAKGALLLLTGISIFTVQDVIIRLMSGDYPVHQLMAFRSGMAAPLIVLAAALSGRLANLKMKRWGLHLLRGGFMVLTYTSYYMAIAELPLASATAIFFAVPIWLTILSVFIFKDRVGLRRWAAILVGFLGVLFIIRPGTDTFQVWGLVSLLSSFFYCVSTTTTRFMKDTETGEGMALSAHLVYVVVALLFGALLGDGRFAGSDIAGLDFALRAWVWMPAGDLGLVALTAVIAAVGFYCLAEGYRLAPASRVAPMEYAAIVWASIWGYLVWAEVPIWATWLGMVLIVASGLYILRREEVKDQAIVTGKTLRPKV